MSYRSSKSGFFVFQEEESVEPNDPKWRVPEWFPELGEDKINKLSLYHKDLLRFNSKINLISPNTQIEADEIHFADSIISTFIISQSFTGKSMVDIGSGNGFPGLVFAILNPDVQVTLVDSDVRKTEFLRIVVGRLEITNCAVKTMKLEEIPDDSIEFGISRAFAPLSKSLVLARKKFKLDSKYYHLKTDSWGTEISQIPVQACTYWSNELMGEYQLPDSGKRLFIIASTKEEE